MSSKDVTSTQYYISFPREFEDMKNIFIVHGIFYKVISAFVIITYSLVTSESSQTLLCNF